MSNSKNTYRISNSHSGQDLGDYEAATEREALDAMAQDAGFNSFAESCAGFPVADGEIVVELVEQTDVTFAVINNSVFTTPSNSEGLEEIMVSADGTVRAWDDVDDAWTTCHQLGTVGADCMRELARLGQLARPGHSELGRLAPIVKIEHDDNGDGEFGTVSWGSLSVTLWRSLDDDDTAGWVGSHGDSLDCWLSDSASALCSAMEDELARGTEEFELAAKAALEGRDEA